MTIYASGILFSQLRLEIDAANTSKSSCSSALSTEKTGNNELELNAPVREEDHEDAGTIPRENKNPSPVKAPVSQSSSPIYIYQVVDTLRSGLFI